MFSRAKLYQTLNLKEGEEKAVFLLFTYSFFIGIAFAFFYTATTSLFLVEFKRGDLPIAYIISGFVAYGIGIPFHHLQRRIPFKVYIAVALLFLIVSSFAIPLLINVSPVLKHILIYTGFVWVRVFVFIMGISFWGVASRLFDLRQSKRVFSFINNGEVISFLLSFFSIPFILKIKGVTTQSLLFFAVIALILGFSIMLIILRLFKDKLISKPHPPKEKTEKKHKQPIFKSNYHRLIYLLAFMPVISLIFVDFIFFAQSQINYQGQGEALSSFLAIVLGFNSLIEFFAKSFIAGKLINRYGIKLGLISLPVVMLICIVLASLAGSFDIMLGLFFPLITLSKLLLRSVRTSFYDASFQILFQPIPVSERIDFQSQIEAGPKSLGNVVAGVLVLLLTFIGSIQLVHFSYIFLLIILIWLRWSISMYREYRSTLKDIIAKRSVGSLTTKVKANIELLADQLSKAKASNALPIINVIDKIDPDQIDKMLTDKFRTLDLTNTKEQATSKLLLEEIERKQIISLLPYIEEKLKDLSSGDLYDRLHRTKELLETSQSYPFEKLAHLTKSESVDDRVMAARLIRQSRRYNAYQLTKILLSDSNIAVQREALITAGKIKHSDLLPLVIEKLSSPLFANTATSAIFMIGEPILNELDLFFEKTENKETHLRIIRIYETIGGSAVIRVLRNKINFPEKDVRFYVLNALSNLQYRPSSLEIPYINQALEDEISLTAWILASIVDLGRTKDTADLQNALRHEIRQTNDRIFILLSLLYDSKTVKLVEENLRKGDDESKGYALEIMDMLISEDTKKLILPIFEDLSEKELVDYYKPYFAQQKLERFERLKDILLKDYSRINRWTKALTFKLLATCNTEEVKPLLAANIVHPDPLLQQIAVLALHRLDSKYMAEQITHYGIKKSAEIQKLIDDVEKNNQLCYLDKVKLLKHNLYFAAIPEVNIIRLALSAQRMVVLSGNHLVFNDHVTNYFFIVIHGKIDHIENNKIVKSFEVNSLIGDVTEVVALRSGALYKAAVNTELLRINIDLLYELMSENVEVTGKIVNLIKLQSITRKYD